MGKKILFILTFAAVLIMSCAKREGQISRNNPFDVNGTNYFPPVVTAMDDTTVFIRDSVYLHAAAIDSNGYACRYIWAVDGKNFRDTANSVFLRIFNAPGKDTILVRAIDNDGVKSKNTDTVIVAVMLGRPVISVAPDGMVVGIGDSVKLIAACRDTNGAIKALYWAMDGINFSSIPGPDTIKTAYQTQGVKTIIAKTLDDDSLEACDTVRVYVRDKAPLIFSPLPDAALANNTTTLQWRPGFYNNHYQVLVDTVNPPAVIVNAATRDTFSVVSNLMFNKTYWWKVVGFDGSGLISSSEIWKFTTPIKPPIPTDGLVAYYPFNGNANDESGNGNNGTVYGATLTGDRFGNSQSAYYFNGTSYITVKHTASLNTGLFTISAWVKAHGTGDGYQHIISKSINSGGSLLGYCLQYYYLSAEQGNNKYGFWTANGSTDNHLLYNNVIVDSWTYIVGTFNGSNVKFYINGICVDSAICSVSLTNVDLHIGNMSDNNNFLTGSIDDIRIYNRALNAQEIQSLYQEGGYVPPLSKPSLSAWGVDSTKITLKWSNVTGATGYTLESASDSTGPFSQLYSGSDTIYSQTGLTNNQNVWYRLKATNATQASEWSDMAGAVANGTVIYVDGNVYHTVAIGTQVWMVENLKTTKYNDGAAIPLVTDGTAWAALAAPGYCWFNNDSSSNKNTYGALYNWYTVNTGKLAPTGWHVPTDSEWSVLTTYLGGESVAGGKLKEAGTAHWNSPNTGATNETGFSALPAGCRLPTGSFYEIDNFGGWWSSTVAYTTSTWGRYVAYNLALVDRSTSPKKQGFSVRCVRN